MGKYPLLGKVITFEECNERFSDIQYQSWKAQEAASVEFDKWYDACGDILSVLKGYEKKASALIIKNANSPLFSELPKLDIYDISEDSYDDDCLILDDTYEALAVVADAYNSIIEQQEAEEEYRAERKASRGRVVGGGFGVGGALKGMATAGAMNAVSGMGHSLANAIGNARSAAEASSAKRALYNNASVKRVLRASICDDILACFNAHIHLINDKKGHYYISCFDSDKAGALFQNAKIVPEKRKELLVESFKNCPWDKEVLAYIFVNFVEERKNVWEIAKRFHVDLHETAEEAFATMYSPAAKNSEEKACAVKKEILDQMQLLGITVSATVDRIERDCVTRLLNGYPLADEAKRSKMFEAVDTFDASERNKGVVIHDLGVWELAKKYRVKFTPEEIEKLISNLYTPSAKKSEEDALIAKKKMLAIMQALSVKDSTAFNQLEADCLARLCPDYQKADETTCNAMLKVIKEYDALEKNKKPFINKIKSRIEAIWSAEDGEIFDNVYLNTDIENPEEIQKAMTFIQGKKRTNNGNRYLNALGSCTPENLKKAKTFQADTTKLVSVAGLALLGFGIISMLFLELGFIVSLLIIAAGSGLLAYYYSLKKVWDVLTLNGTLVHAKISLTGQAQRASISKSPAQAAAAGALAAVKKSETNETNKEN